MSLSADEVRGLLKPKPKQVQPKYPPPPQYGPLRFCDNEMRCLNRRCGAPTYIKIRGVPTCYMHALRQLNEMIIELTEGRT